MLEAMNTITTITTIAADSERWGSRDGPPWPVAVLFVVLAAAVASAVIYLLWARITGGSQRAATASAVGILAERYARGEIDQREYQERLSNLPTRRPRNK